MKKVALLIGVSEFSEPDLKPLPNAVKDGSAIAQVLQRPEICGFAADQVTVLSNPSKQEAQDAIHQLFGQREKEDLLLFYFSGHGVRDDRGQLYLALPETRKENGKLVRHTAIDAQFLHSEMEESRSDHQVLIFDCCFSGAIAQGLKVKDDGSVALDQQIGGKGRAILTSSNSIEYSFAPEDLPLSVYTHYLVEGLEKGGADLDGDGQIAVDELHQYVFDKVKTAAPAMTPQFFPVREGYRIFLARSPQDDPKVKYRRKVREYVKAGNYRLEKGCFTVAARRYLDRFFPTLNLTPEVAQEVEEEVLDPIREYQSKLQEYRTLLDEVLEEEKAYPFGEATLAVLQDFQQLLGLRGEDIEAVERSILVCQPEPDTVTSQSEPNVDVSGMDTSILQDAEDHLRSEKGIDYTRLRDLLKANKWQEADQETRKVMLQAVGRKSNDWIREEECLNFPCADLQTIDRLWVKYSQGRFGFSVQKKIYVECGGKLDGKYPGDEIWRKFGDRVGWRKNGEWMDYTDVSKNISLSSPQGIFPLGGGELLLEVFGEWMYVLFSRIQACEL
jgi:uncharacterized caspase-like protein